MSDASANTLAGNPLVFPQVNSAKWLIYEPFRAFHSAGKRFASGTALFWSTRSLTELQFFISGEKKENETSTSSRIQSDVHQATIDADLNLPFAVGRVSPYAIGGAGALIFNPTNNKNGSVSGASRDARGAILYGVGVKYPLVRSKSLLWSTEGSSIRMPILG